MEEIKEITPAEVKEKLERGEKLNIVDVREDEEVALGMIPGAKHIKMVHHHNMYLTSGGFS
ncbi:rhodanese-like domain-containing protein [Geobacillus stearothermophilus]|uniref:rhodanese-like domain-containing protein n=1 Tax=Geobacillus stearothermophilus TaxID=1422 RepID=UPI000ABA2E65